MNIYNPAIIIITYNRPLSLKRVLESVSKGIYKNFDIPLIISVDYQDSENHNQVLKIANEFNWEYGKKLVVEHKQNLGLRKHVISCGNLSEKYGAIIMLEDDIFVSPQFYNYCIQMLDFYHSKDYIAGISLFKHLINVNINRPFYPMDNDYDVFLMQFAQSWGQCWTYNMWNGFFNWYKNNKDLCFGNSIPEYVKNWPETSWLKYFIKYVVETNKYFVYPYESLSTNFGDTGTHNAVMSSDFQVPLQIKEKKYKAPEIDQAVIYDSFYEHKGIEKYLNLDSESLCVDLYSSKKTNEQKRYWLSMESRPYKVIRSFGLNLRPHELNVILDNKGEDIFLYDTKFSEKKIDNKNYLLTFLYDYPRLTRKKIIKYLYYKLLKI